VDDAERKEEGETHGRRGTCAVQRILVTVEEIPDSHRLRGDIWDAAAKRAAQGYNTRIC
jgi:hypothetical protein